MEKFWTVQSKSCRPKKSFCFEQIKNEDLLAIVVAIKKGRGKTERERARQTAEIYTKKDGNNDEGNGVELYMVIVTKEYMMLSMEEKNMLKNTWF